MKVIAVDSLAQCFFRKLVFTLLIGKNSTVIGADSYGRFGRIDVFLVEFECLHCIFSACKTFGLDANHFIPLFRIIEVGHESRCIDQFERTLDIALGIKNLHLVEWNGLAEFWIVRQAVEAIQCIVILAFYIVDVTEVVSRLIIISRIAEVTDEKFIFLAKCLVVRIVTIKFVEILV